MDDSPEAQNARLMRVLRDVLDGYHPVRAALAELVALKTLKDTEGKTEEYARRQPLAWAAARTALGMVEATDAQTE